MARKPQPLTEEEWAIVKTLKRATYRGQVQRLHPDDADLIERAWSTDNARFSAIEAAHKAEYMNEVNPLAGRDK